MPYVTTTQLRDRLGTALYARLTDRVNGTTASDTVAQQIIEEAEAEANSYLARRYATPVDLAAHPEIADALEGAALDLAEHRAWRTSPFASAIPARVELAYEAARQWLSAVAAGAVDLPGSSPLPPRTSENDGPRFTAQPRRFTSQELDGL
jgi:phage gp36-like protein